MEMEMVCLKILTDTDIRKRLSVPTKNKQCFLDLRGQNKVEFKVRDKNARVWPFVCSTRKNKAYPKPVLSKGWLQFVRHWRLAVGDKVIFHRKQGQYIIEVIKRKNKRSSVVSPLAWNQDADRTMSMASHSNDEEEPTITSTSHFLDQASDSGIEEDTTFTSHSRAQAITYDQTEWLHSQPPKERVGLNFEFVREPKFIDFFRLERKFIDFFELGSQERRGNEQPSSQRPIMSSTAPNYFEFL